MNILFDLLTDNLRGSRIIKALPSASKYVAIRQLKITNAQIEDSATYKCTAQNPTINGGAVDERKIKVTIKPPNGKISPVIIYSFSYRNSFLRTRA